MLNGCRAGLEADPLSWPFSSLREALGFAAGGVRGPVRGRTGYFRWVSSDHTTDPDGCPYPLGLGIGTADELPGLRDAVSEFLRVPIGAVSRRGRARSLYLRAARVLTEACPRAIGEVVGVTSRQVRRVAPTRGRDLDALAVMMRDPRFSGIDDARVRRGRTARSSRVERPPWELTEG